MTASEIAQEIDIIKEKSALLWDKNCVLKVRPDP